MKKLILLSATLLFVFITNAQIVNIPDANFKAYLVGNSSINTNMDAEIQVSEANSFTGTINVLNDSISDLTGIEAFTALTYLSCENNQLSILDVSNNTALTNLICQYNQLTSLDVSHNTALTNLFCDHNQLTSLDVSYNTVLTNLSCGYNQLTSLNVSYNTALVSLNCSGSQLTSLDVSYNTALEGLACAQNPLTSLDVSNNTALITLNCSYSLVTSLNIPNNDSLISLSCYGNQLTSLDISNAPSLTTLKCYNNQLTYLDVTNNIELIHLVIGSATCGSNDLSCLDISQNTLLEDIQICDMTTLNEVCVWELPFPPTGVLAETTGSPNIYYTTDCNCTNNIANTSIEKSKINIYPNPTSGLIAIEAKEIESIEIIDLHGKQIYTGKETEIDLSNNPKGMYIIKIITDKQTITRKLIKQ